MPSSWLGYSCDKAIDKSLVRNYHFGGLSLPEISGNIYFCDFTIGDSKEQLRSRLVTTCDSVESCRFWMFLGLRACSESCWTSLYFMYTYIYIMNIYIYIFANSDTSSHKYAIINMQIYINLYKLIIFLTLSPTKLYQTKTALTEHSWPSDTMTIRRRGRFFGQDWLVCLWKGTHWQFR